MRGRRNPIYILLAGAVLGMIVMPIAFAGAAGNPQATTSASVKKQVKKLKQQVNLLRQQVEDVSKQPGPAGQPGPATGPAGGDLTGQYPNPLIGPAAVGTDELADDSVVNAKIPDNTINGIKVASDTITSTRLSSNSVGTDELVPDSVNKDKLGPSSVGGSELRDLTATVSAGVGLNNNTPGDAQVTCPEGQQVVGGGYAWTQDEANSIIASAPSEADPNRTWVVRGMPTGGSSNTLFAWANCLAG
jgi:hypothetical protein